MLNKKKTGILRGITYPILNIIQIKDYQYLALLNTTKDTIGSDKNEYLLKNDSDTKDSPTLTK